MFRLLICGEVERVEGFGRPVDYGSDTSEMACFGFRPPRATFAAGSHVARIRTSVFFIFEPRKSA